MQMFPWVGTLDAAKSEAALRSKVQYERFRNVRTALFYGVKATWYTLYLIREEIAITNENLDILRTLEELAINRFKSPEANRMKMGQMNGTGTGMVDVLRIQMQINALESKLDLLTDRRGVMTAQFNELLNRPAKETIILPDSLGMPGLPVPIAQIPDSIRQSNPMLKALAHEENAFLSQKEKNRKMGLPVIGLGLQYGMFQERAGSDLAMNGRDMLMPMATVRIPLWRRKYRASVRESDLKRQAAMAKQRDVGNKLQVSYKEAMKNYRDAERRGDLYQRQSALAQQALNILSVAYSSADSDFEELLRMQLRLLDYRLEERRAIVDQHVAVAMLERLIGR